MGRKKLGNVLFARRLSPEDVAKVEALLAGRAVPVGVPANPRPLEDLVRAETPKGPETAPTWKQAVKEELLASSEIKRLKAEVDMLKKKVKGYEEMYG